MIELQVNGELRRVPEGTTAAGLLEQLGLLPAVVVVERNRVILPREALAGTALEAGDQLELVHFVGGG
jgi:thiamine biosynthesis protein ThiS